MIAGIHCDELISLSKSVLTDYIGILSMKKIKQLDRALVMALDISSDIALGVHC